METANPQQEYGSRTVLVATVMVLPFRLQERLDESRDLRAAVDRALLDFEPWLSISRLPFFPEYTDHGVPHVESVLRTATSLIRDEAWPLFTPADAAALTLAVLLHDIGMHLTEDMFASIVASPATPCVSGLDRESWAVLWEDFRSESRRFDTRMLLNVTGQEDPVEPPDPTAGFTSDLQRRLAGEFIRRHHPRMAHEFAVSGAPTVAGDPLRLSGLDTDLADIVGLVARSHGMPLRECVEYLRRYNAVREHKRVHAVFLMALIRVADYLQLQSERAPKEYLRVQRLRSPLSRREWAVHAAVADIRQDDNDPEALYIHAAPQTYQAFARLEEWLAGVQREIDASWALLGETYGYRPGFDQFGLVLRRITSNLHDPQLQRALPFIPLHAEFTTAHADLLKLLIEPLYGRRPDIGVRELLQNAIVAVHEMDDYLTQCPELRQVPRLQLAAEVVITVEDHEDGTATLTIADRGVGMTAETVRDYFLRAGATFRRSDAWLRRHADQSGEPRVLRSGRFGIGALAAFLLGDEIEVTTRHVSGGTADGVNFKATLQSQSIELLRSSEDVGTRITVRIARDTREQLRGAPGEGPFSGLRESSWDWYCSAQPTVLRQHLPSGNVLEQRYHVPTTPGDSIPGWRKLTVPGYDAVYWTHNDAPRLSHNGMRIDLERGAVPEQLGYVTSLFRFTTPKVSVVDRRGLLPLNLQRSALTTRHYPFSDALFEDVLDDFIAFALLAAPNTPILEAVDPQEYFHVGYRGLVGEGLSLHTPRGPWTITPWFASEHGVGFLDPGLIAAAGTRCVIVVGGSLSVPLMRAFGAGGVEVMVAPTREREARKPLELIQGVGAADQVFSPQGQRSTLAGRRILYLGPDSPELREFASTAERMERRFDKQRGRLCLILEWGRCPSERPPIEELIRTVAQPGMGSELYLTAEFADQKRSPLAERWLELLGSPTLPYSLSQRRSTLGDAFHRLAPSVVQHETALPGPQPVGTGPVPAGSAAPPSSPIAHASGTARRKRR